MIRIYETSKGIIVTDEQNKSMTRPGYALGLYYGDNVIHCRFIKNIAQPGDFVEERCANGNTMRVDNRALNEYPVLERVATISFAQYDALVREFEHPGCVGKALSYIGIKRTLQDVIKKNLDTLAPSQKA